MRNRFHKAVKTVKTLTGSFCITVDGSIIDLWDNMPEHKFGYSASDFYSAFVLCNQDSILTIDGAEYQC